MADLCIANCSGYYGDRMSALSEVAHTPGVQVITGDYLAEVTMLVLAKGQARNPNAGYAASFPEQLAASLDVISSAGIKVVVNAGGLNPTALVAQVNALSREKGFDLSVAIADGDDLLPDLERLQAARHSFSHLRTGEALERWPFEPLTANAYLGGWGIAAALDRGADIVVTGRVTDASLVVGPAAWWHGWSRTDFDQISGAIVAGHIIECGTQATGGNYSGFTTLGPIGTPSFPLATIRADGSADISLSGQGGAVTIGTVTAQLLYEIDAPRYPNPDAVALFDTVQLDQVGRNVVRISGTKGTPPPPTTKVAITAMGGFRNEFTAVVTGLDIDAKVTWLRTAVDEALAEIEGIDDVVFEQIGSVDLDGADQGAMSMLVRTTATGTEVGVGRAFGAAIVSLGLANIPGFYGLSLPGPAQSFGTYWPALIDTSAVPHRVIHHDGSVEHVPPTPGEVLGPSPPCRNEPGSLRHGPTVAVRLGELVDARSGDKGGDANVGVWVRDSTHWPWLRDQFTVDKFRQLVPESAQLVVDRYEFANLNAVNFVVRGLLGDGATANTRVDSQAKALGEYLRGRTVDVPADILRPG